MAQRDSRLHAGDWSAYFTDLPIEDVKAEAAVGLRLMERLYRRFNESSMKLPFVVHWHLLHRPDAVAETCGCGDPVFRGFSDDPDSRSRYIECYTRGLPETHPCLVGVNRKLFPGVKFFEPGSCFSCGKPSKNLCSKCTLARYCSAECQKVHWKVHKPFCFTATPKKKEKAKSKGKKK